MSDRHSKALSRVRILGGLFHAIFTQNMYAQHKETFSFEKVSPDVWNTLCSYGQPAAYALPKQM